MGPWVYAAPVVAVVTAVLVGVFALRSARRSRAELQRQLLSARADVEALSDRLHELSQEVADARRAVERREAQPVVITGIITEPDRDLAPRDAQLVQAIEAGRPEWVPAKPLREALIRTVSVGSGVRRALSPDKRDRILLEMRAEVRRSRRQRKAELKAVKKYLRDRRKTAA